MLSEAGHFLQEDTPEKIVAIVTDFLRKNPGIFSFVLNLETRLAVETVQAPSFYFSDQITIKPKTCALKLRMTFYTSNARP